MPTGDVSEDQCANNPDITREIAVRGAELKVSSDEKKLGIVRVVAISWGRASFVVLVHVDQHLTCAYDVVRLNAQWYDQHAATRRARKRALASVATSSKGRSVHFGKEALA